MSSAALIVNPAAGRGRAASLAQRAALRLREHGWSAEVIVASSPAESTQLARQSAQQGASVLVACGGDGTINCVIQGLVGQDVPLGILPLGTGDDNARLFDIPRGDVEGAADVVAHGQVLPVDLGVVEFDDGSSRYFLGVLSTGFDSDVNEVANELRHFSGTTKYLVAMVKRLRSFAPIEYRITTDGMPSQGRAMLVSVGNGRSYGGGMQVTPNADPCDGLLDMVWLDEVSTATLLRVFPLVYSGRHVQRPEVHLSTAREFRIEAPGQIAYADGERFGALPITVRIVPGALPVMVPVP